MAYQVLANKWRPKSFEKMVGQTHILRALVNALNSGRLHHAYLFTGTRGVGKTTIARILAKALSCDIGVSGKPCGQCSACLSIDQGKYVDLIEVDAASRTKVEDTRELLDNVQYSPALGRYKIYLIDEVHMLSTHSFNALLKTLEEPPDHVKFLFATTDPKKLPVTILSRCLQFNLKRLPPDLIEKHLQSIIKQEGFSNEPKALVSIAKAADGSMRDALSLLDQALAYGDQKLTEDEVYEMLGTIKQDYLTQILDALAENSAEKIYAITSSIAMLAPDYHLIIADLISMLHRIALAQFSAESVNSWYGDKQKLLALSKQFSEEDVQLYYQIALHGRQDLPLAPEPAIGFEMMLLRMLAFKPVTVEGKPSHAKSSQGRADSSQTGTIAKPEPEAHARSTVHSTPVVESSPPQKQDGQSENLNADTRWQDMIVSMGVEGPAKQLATMCALVKLSDSIMVLQLDPKYQQICNEHTLGRLETCVSKLIGNKIKVKVDFVQPTSETPAQCQERIRQEKHNNAVDSIKQDATVQELQSIFGAQIKPELIQSNENTEE